VGWVWAGVGWRGGWGGGVSLVVTQFGFVCFFSVGGGGFGGGGLGYLSFFLLGFVLWGGSPPRFWGVVFLRVGFLVFVLFLGVGRGGEGGVGVGGGGGGFGRLKL